MSFKADIGVIGALSDEVASIIDRLEDRREATVSGIEFNYGYISGKAVVVAKCGVGKVFAAGDHTKTYVAATEKLVVVADLDGVGENSVWLSVGENALESRGFELLIEPLCLIVAGSRYLHCGVANIGYSFERLRKGIQILGIVLQCVKLSA